MQRQIEIGGRKWKKAQPPPLRWRISQKGNPYVTHQGKVGVVCMPDRPGAAIYLAIVWPSGSASVIQNESAAFRSEDEAKRWVEDAVLRKPGTPPPSAVEAVTLSPDEFQEFRRRISL